MGLSSDLASLHLFRGCESRSLRLLAAVLAPRNYRARDVLMRQGDLGTFFMIVLTGQVSVSRAGRTREHPLGTAGPGAILGELSALTGRPRQATIIADTDTRVAVGDRDAFAVLLDVPGLQAQLADIAAHRLAQIAVPVPLTLRDGTPVKLRPLLPNDREGIVSAFARQSPESLRRRFFSVTQPSPAMIDYLVNINYIDHFAWVMVSHDGGHGLGQGRYVRLRDDQGKADVAFDVADDYQSRGIGTLLLGALAPPAAIAGVTSFVADVLYENAPMRAVLTKAGATWGHLEPGVLTASLAVSAAQALVDEPLRAQLARVANDVVTAAGLALAGEQAAAS